MADSIEQFKDNWPYMTDVNEGMCRGSSRPPGITIVMTPIDEPVLNMLSRVA